MVSRVFAGKRGAEIFLVRSTVRWERGRRVRCWCCSDSSAAVAEAVDHRPAKRDDEVQVCDVHELSWGQGRQKEAASQWER